MSEFGFMVTLETSKRWGGTQPEPDCWSVRLPSMGDDWHVTYDYRGQPHAEAVAVLERFIAEAQAALVALRERREVASNPDTPT